jgi:predicted nucleic acid-binding protein
MIVVDASVTVDALTDDGDVGGRARAALAKDSHWAAPEHLQVEVTSGIRGRWLGGKLTTQRADDAVRTLGSLTINYVSWYELADRVWELRNNFTPYDAAYVALAEQRGVVLVTSDPKLADSSSRRCAVEVVGA